MHSPSLWYETEVRNFLMIIFLRNIEILYLECVSTNDYMLILCCLVLFGPKSLFLSFSFSLIHCNCVMGRKCTLSDIERDLKSLRRRGKWVREILESSILPADSGTPNATALMKWHTGTYLTCFRRLW